MQVPASTTGNCGFTYCNISDQRLAILNLSNLPIGNPSQVTSILVYWCFEGLSKRIRSQNQLHRAQSILDVTGCADSV